ncbi:aromatic amino acid ammonia-lyase [Streptomyces sp. NPDC005876]|uniref:HAL/PAL/TAL family ammonia-lyase n=1 Tax=Streptomyces sp. NPDC005876 TaxID=3157076 RepID=UPI0033F0DB07
MTASTMPTLRVGSPLTLHALEQATGPVDVQLTGDVRARIAACRSFMEECLKDDEQPVYGAKTGFGPLVRYPGRTDSADQCDSLLAHLGAGQGPDLCAPVARATMLTRLWSLTRGYSGVSPHVVETLGNVLRTTIVPAIPEYGSLGASGDLIPLAHLTYALRGEGHAYLNGQRVPSDEALASEGISPLRLDGRDALAMTNGTSCTAAAAGLAAASISRSHRAAHLLTALLTDLIGAASGYASPHLLRAYNHIGAERSAQRLRRLMEGAQPADDRPLQEPYSIRCTPQLLGAADTGLSYAVDVILTDVNGVSDNPLFFPEEQIVAHGGNFFSQPVAFASDHLSLIAAQLGNLVERQLDLLLDPHRNSGLNPMLATLPGEQHGLQGAQLTATAIVTKMRRACNPASMQSLPTNGRNQDIVPMGTQAALTAFEQARSLRWLQGTLALAVRQAYHITNRRPTSIINRHVVEQLEDTLRPVDPDRPLHADVRQAADLLDSLTNETHSSALAALVIEESGSEEPF